MHFDEVCQGLARKGAGLRKLQAALAKDTGKARITHITDKQGNFRNETDDICEVFATFYEDLYRASPDALVQQRQLRASNVGPCVSLEELQSALGSMKDNRCADADGLVAEMLKTGHKGLLNAIAQLFSDILCGDALLPSEWKMARLSLLFKGGDASLPKNYRPISIIPILAKAFSALLYKRVQNAICAKLPDWQYGFRSGRGCDDALHVLRTVVEKSSEWDETLWMTTLDVEKAFDRVHHSKLFDAMLQFELDVDAVGALLDLYSEMTAYVQLGPGATSRHFRIERGVRQGDPLSPVLFSIVLAQAVGRLQATWTEEGYGTIVGPNSGTRLTHVAFAVPTI